MTTIFALCAVIGGTVLVCQFLLTVLGFSDGEHFGDDVSGDGADLADHSGSGDHHGSTWFFGVVTFRTLVAAVAFFGLTGLAADSAGLETLPTVTFAVVVGFAAMYVVHWAMLQMARLRADGTVRIEQAMGASGHVYLRIPGHRQGAGKIHLNLQQRTVEVDAFTGGEEIPTGTPIVVVNVLGPEAVEVEPAPASQEVTHV